MPQHGAGEDVTFHVAANLDQIIWRIAMVDALHALFDDRTLIKVGGHIVGRGPDDLDPSLKGLMLRLGPLKAGQE